MKKKTKVLKAKILTSDIQSDKQFVDNLMRRVARLRFELKNHFEKSETTSTSEILDDEVSSCDNLLMESYCCLNGVHATLIEMEVSHDNN